MEVSVLTLAGTIIIILLSIVGWFMSRIISDVKECINETGKNKGRIDLIAKQQENDVVRIEKSTNSELQNLTKKVCLLTDNVNALVLTLAENGIKTK
jgi:hypothetical protein